MASPPSPPRFHDPVVVQSKARNVLRLEVLVSVTIPGRLCRVLLPLLSSVCGVGKREKERETVNDVASVPRHVKRVRPVEHGSDLKEVLLGVVGGELEGSRDGAVVEYEGLPATIKHVMETFARQAGRIFEFCHLPGRLDASTQLSSLALSFVRYLIRTFIGSMVRQETNCRSHHVPSPMPSTTSRSSLRTTSPRGTYGVRCTGR